MRRHLLTLIVIAVLLAACAPQATPVPPTATPYRKEERDKKKEMGKKGGKL